MDWRFKHNKSCHNSYMVRKETAMEMFTEEYADQDTMMSAT